MLQTRIRLNEVRVVLRNAEAVFEAAWQQPAAPVAPRARVCRARTLICRQEVQPIANVELQVDGAHDSSTGDPIANVRVGLPVQVFNRNQGNVGMPVPNFA